MYLLIIVYLFSCMQYKIVFGHITEKQLSDDTVFENNEQGLIEELNKTFYVRYGLLAKPGQFTFAVSLSMYEPDYQICGGSIISTKYVLTAAHCICREYPAEEYFIIAGVVDYERDTRKIFKVHALICHPEYNRKTLHNDIGLVQIKKQFKFSRTIQPIPLVEADTSKPVPGGLTVTTAGWGETENEYYKPYNELRYTHTHTIPNEDCKQRMKQIEGIDLYVINSTICTLSPTGSQPCQGDSGGPLVYKDQLMGVVSWIAGSHCVAGQPDGFTSVAHHREWISHYVQ